MTLVNTLLFNMPNICILTPKYIKFLLRQVLSFIAASVSQMIMNSILESRVNE